MFFPNLIVLNIEDVSGWDNYRGIEHLESQQEYGHEFSAPMFEGLKDIYMRVNENTVLYELYSLRKMYVYYLEPEEFEEYIQRMYIDEHEDLHFVVDIEAFDSVSDPIIIDEIRKKYLLEAKVQIKKEKIIHFLSQLQHRR